MNAETLKAAIDAGAAYSRQLTRIHRLVAVPDREFAVVVIDPTGKITSAYDFDKCKRMSRGMARRTINSMTDAPAELKRFYIDLLDGNVANGEGGAE